MKRRLPPHSLYILLILLGCGVTVGNSGPPPVATDSSFATLVGMEHDEVISSVFEQNSSDASPDLALLEDPTTQCTEDANTGSILFERTDQADGEFEIG